MARGGGSSHGGGGHSGGRSFGGRSGGGFSGGRGGGSFGGPGFGGPRPGGPRPGGPRPGGPRPGGPGFGGPHWGGPRWGGPVFFGGGWGRPPRRSSGCGCSMIIAALILLIIVSSLLIVPNSGSYQTPETEITVSRTERTAITGTRTYGEWYTDEMGFIDHDTDLTDGLKYFYSQTGIQPYVMILDYDPTIWINGSWSESAAESYLAQAYQDTFSDNGHMILAYFACENDSEDMDGTFYIYYGSAAYSVMDDEAETIFWSYFEMNYNNLDLSIAEFIGNSFQETADNIMHTGNSSQNGNSTLFRVGTVFAVICVVVIVIGIVVMKKSTRREEAE